MSAARLHSSRIRAGSRRALAMPVIAAAALILHAIGGLAGNSVSGDLKGMVVDAGDGSPVAAAVIEVHNEASGARWSTLSFADGSYKIAMLSSGRYTVLCRHPDYLDVPPYGPVYVALVKPTSLKVPPFAMRKKPGQTTRGASGQRAPFFVLRRPQSGLGARGLFEEWLPGGPAVDAPEPVPQVLPQPQPAALPPGQAQAVQLVNSENALRGGNFEERYLSSLPLPGIRTFDNLAFLVAGVSEPPEPLSSSAGPAVGRGLGTPGQFSVNGMRSRANSFTLDGSDNNDQDIAVRRQGFLSLASQSIESIQEFQIATLLWDAELGRNLGSQVNAVSKSGTDRLHGQVYGFLTDSRVNARNFFDYMEGPAPGKDPFTRVQAGIAGGGPLVRGRTHLQGSFEYQSVQTSHERHFSTPRGDERRFLGLDRFKVITSPVSLNSAFDYETSAGATPLGLNLLSLLPPPNNPAGPFGSNTYSRLLPAGGTGAVASIKATHQVATRHSLAVRYNFTDDERRLPSVGNALSSTIDSATRAQNISLILDSALSRTSLNQARFSFGRTRLRFAELEGGLLSLAREDRVLRGSIDAFLKTGEPIGGEVTASSSTGPLGELIVRPFSPVGLDAAGFPQSRTNNTLQFADTVSKVWRSHTLKFGGDIRIGQFNSREDRNYRASVEVNNGTVEIVDLDAGSSSGPRFLHGIQFANIGQVSSIFQTITAGPPNSHVGLRFREFNFFVNDNWRIRPALHLDWGVRYERNTVPREVNARIENALALNGLPASGSSPFDSLAATAAFDRAVAAYRTILESRTSIYRPDNWNFGPHVGLAWDPGGGGRMSVRSGYGIYHDTILGAVVSQSRNAFPSEIPFLSEATFFGHDGLNANNPAFFGLRDAQGRFQSFLIQGTNQLAGSRRDFVALVGALLDSATEAGGLTFTLPDNRLRSPYVQQWHLTLERELRDDYVVGLSYVGTKGTRLTRLTTPNGGARITPHQTVVLRRGAAPAVSFDTSNPTRKIQYAIGRPVAALGAYRIFENSAVSSYNALQVEARRRYSRGLTFTAAYTWSHAIDEVSDFIETGGAPSLPQDAGNLKAERGSAAYDVRHRFAASAIADLPSLPGNRGIAAVILTDWQLSSILYARSGQPFTLAVPVDANLDGNLTDRPSTTEGLLFFDGHGPRRVALGPGRSVEDFYVAGRNGVVGRGTGRGDTLVNWDVALTRTIRFRDARSLELRVEAFNLLNRANFSLPVRTIGDPGFGSSTSTATPARVVQFAARISF
jgi:hypothetical protein